MRLKLNDKQVEKIADLWGDVGLIMLASVAIPSFLDKFKVSTVSLGILAAVFCWILCIRLLKSL